MNKSYVFTPCGHTYRVSNISNNSICFRSENELKDNILVTEVWKNLCSALDQKKLIMAPFCGAVACEEKIKKDSARYDNEECSAVGRQSPVRSFK